MKRTRFNEILDNFKNLKPILVLGDIGIDKYTFGEVNRISPEAPVPILNVTKEWEKLGLAANISDNLKELEINSILCGVTGDDLNANILESLLESRSIKTWGIVREKNRKTTFKERIITGTQQICRIDYEEICSISKDSLKLIKDRITDFFNEEISAVIIEDYSKGLFSEELLNYIISMAQKNNCFVSVDPGKNTDPLWYKGCNLLKPNLTEAIKMVKKLRVNENNMSLDNIASILVKDLNLEKIIITLGAEGLFLLDSSNEDGPIRISTVAKEVFDVSGAGDTTITLICSSLMSGASLKEASIIANYGAGIVVAKNGTATVNIQELKDSFKK